MDAHHIHHWAHGGEPTRSNLVSLCQFHHRKVHEGRVAIEVLDAEALRFRKPSSESFESVAAEHSLAMTNWREVIADNGGGIWRQPRTATTRWTGEAMDYQIAIDSLLFRERRAAESAPEPESAVAPRGNEHSPDAIHRSYHEQIGDSGHSQSASRPFLHLGDTHDRRRGDIF